MSEIDFAKSDSRLLVIGSYNLDLISNTKELPLPGETVLGNYFFTSHGGKGSNQAVSATRLGQHTTFIAKVGKDPFGSEAVNFLNEEGIFIDHIEKIDDISTGTAQIVVNQNGENIIVVSPGANDHLSVEDVQKREHLFKETDVILVQFEIPRETIKTVIHMTKKHKKILIVNPAPATLMDEEDLSQIDYLIPNENELRVLSKEKNKLQTIAEVKNAGRKLLDQGVKHLVITLGKKGTLYIDKKSELFVPPFEVDMIDSTGAGDCFCGAFAHFLMSNLSINNALSFASAAAALSVTKRGTTTSYPSQEELMVFLRKNNTDV